MIKKLKKYDWETIWVAIVASLSLIEAICLFPYFGIHPYWAPLVAFGFVIVNTLFFDLALATPIRELIHLWKR